MTNIYREIEAEEEADELIEIGSQFLEPCVFDRIINHREFPDIKCRMSKTELSEKTKKEIEEIESELSEIVMQKLGFIPEPGIVLGL